MNESDEPRPDRRFTWPIVTMLVVVLVLYPLSVGPAAVLQTHGHLKSEVEIGYWPIIKLSKQIGCKGALDRDIKWWVRVSGIKLNESRP